MINEKNIEKKFILEMKKAESPLAIYGAGEVASRVSFILKKNKIKIDYVLLDDEWYSPKIVNAIKISKIAELGKINVIIGIRNYRYAKSKLEKIENVNKVFYLNRIYGTETERISKKYWKQNKDLFLETETWLADAASKDCFRRYLKGNQENDALPLCEIFDPLAKQYFSFLKQYLSNEEIFVNCGAYTGDTIQEFLDVTNNCFSKIYAFEPDKFNFEKLSLRISNYPEKIKRKIMLYPYGVSEKKDKVHFVQSDNLDISCGMARISRYGEDKDTITVVSIDEEIGDSNITFLNMDIEGEELKALKGARNLIKKYAPKLAISVYHKKNDLITIPQYIKSLNPRYKFYLVSYCPWCEELVLFAVV